MVSRRNDNWGRASWWQRWKDRFLRLAGEDKYGRSKTPWVMVRDLITLPVRILLGFLVFMVVSWSTTRVGRQFVFGFPAVLVAAGFFGAIWMDQYMGEERAVSYARSRGASHLKNDLEHPWLGEAFISNAVDLKPEDYDLARFELANAHYAAGKKELAVDLVSRLAPLQSTEPNAPFVEGHIWLADFYQSQESEELTAEERRSKARGHYQRVSDTVLAKVGLAAILSNEGELKSASEYLTQVLQTPFNFEDPRSVYAQITSYPTLVDLYNRQDDKEKAIQVCRNGVVTMSRMVIDYPDYLPLWIAISQCCVLTDDFDRAIELLIDGERRAQQNQTKVRIRQLAAEVLVVKAKSVEALENKRNLRYHLIALARAIRTDIRNVEAYRALSKFIDRNQLTDEQVVWVNELVLERGIKGIMHVLAGMQQIVSGQLEPGKNHWEIARQQYAFSPNVIYNLIEVAVQENPDLGGRKIELIEVAMELFPDQPALKLTRGSFLLQDEKYEEALQDFDEAMASESFSNILANRKRILAGMIECQQALGMEAELVDSQARLALIEEMLANRQKQLVEELEKEPERDVAADPNAN